VVFSSMLNRNEEKNGRYQIRAVYDRL